MELQRQQIEQKTKTTRRYDSVTKKIRKLLSASAQTFIPELCEALKDDWYPEFSKNTIQTNKEVRDTIRDKVYRDWSYESGGKYSEDNIWSDSSLQRWIPDWLKNPSEDLKNAARNNVALAREARIKKKILISDREKQKLEDIVTKLPDTVIPPPEPEPSYEGEELDIEGGRLASYGPKGKTTSQMKGDITEHSARLFEALTESTHLPYNNEDLIVDYVKPTRQFRKSIVLELDEQSRKTVWNSLGAVEAVIQDMLDLLEAEIKKEQ